MREMSGRFGYVCLVDFEDGSSGWVKANYTKVIHPKGFFFREKAQGKRWATRAEVTRQMRAGGMGLESVRNFHIQSYGR